MTAYEALSKLAFLPELPALDLGSKAAVIQSLVEGSFLHPSGLLYSILLIDGPHRCRVSPKAGHFGSLTSVAVADASAQRTPRPTSARSEEIQCRPVP